LDNRISSNHEITLRPKSNALAALKSSQKGPIKSLCIFPSKPFFCLGLMDDNDFGCDELSHIDARKV